MLGLRTQIKKGGKEEAEKPFWISFSDLMSALMVLFLVAMAVALLAVTQGLAEIKRAEKDRSQAIDSCVGEIRALTMRDEFRGVSVKGHSIDFGSLAEFGNDQDSLAPQQARFVRAFVPKVLEVARHKNCETWLKRVVVEGFASQVGSYLYNLDLSFRRSQRILCVVLDSKAPDALALADRKQIRSLFLAGGSSFNSVSKSPQEMRRVELRLEFHDLNAERGSAPDIPWDEDTQCPNDRR
jgi:outer membrane protein OmpA-like peptidoglycan-associated protein